MPRKPFRRVQHAVHGELDGAVHDGVAGVAVAEEGNEVELVLFHSTAGDVLQVGKNLRFGRQVPGALRSPERPAALARRENAVRLVQADKVVLVDPFCSVV